MADRVTVTEPYTCTEMTVLADSPQARRWGKPEPKKSAPKRTTSKQSDK